MSAYETESSLYSQTEWTSSPRVKQACLNQDTGLMVIDWEYHGEDVNHNEKMTRAMTTVNGTSKSLSTSYPFIWLRDFCHCEQCFDEASVTKKTNLLDLDFQTTITNTSVDDDGKEISVIWSDNHKSIYPSPWLWCNRFHDTAPDAILDIPPETWRAEELPGRLREFQYDDLMTSDEVMYDWLKEVKVLGVALVKNAPGNKEAITKLGNRVGYLRTTNFGQVSSVYAPTNPKNPVYTAGDLYFHTDLTYWQQQPGVELLQCIKQFNGVGGDSNLADGFNVAKQLKEMDPEAFEILASQELEFFQTGCRGPGKYSQLARNKMIRLDANGELSQISLSNHSRTSIMRMRPEKIASFYKAMRLFISLLYDEKNMYTFKLMPGDILTMNNFRLVHGRKGFEMTKGSERHLTTSYLDWDLVYSRLRVLHKQLDK